MFGLLPFGRMCVCPVECVCWRRPDCFQGHFVALLDPMRSDHSSVEQSLPETSRWRWMAEKGRRWRGGGGEALCFVFWWRWSWETDRNRKSLCGWGRGRKRCRNTVCVTVCVCVYVFVLLYPCLFFYGEKWMLKLCHRQMSGSHIALRFSICFCVLRSYNSAI